MWGGWRPVILVVRVGVRHMYRRLWIRVSGWSKWRDVVPWRVPTWGWFPDRSLVFGLLVYCVWRVTAFYRCVAGVYPSPDIHHSSVSGA